MWRPVISTDYPEEIIYHNARYSTEPYGLFYTENQPHLVQASPQLRELLWSDDDYRRKGSFKRCEHYTLAAYNGPIRFEGIRTHGGGGAYSIVWTNKCPGRWFWDLIPPLAGPQQVAMFGTWDRPFGTEPTLLREDRDVDKVVDPPGLGGLLSTAYAALRPGIKPSMSLVNSLVELKDFKRLPVQLRRVQRGLFRSQDQIRRIAELLRKRNPVTRTKQQTAAAVKRLLQSSPAKVTKEVAEGHLQVQFNLRPLVSDILALYEMISNVAGQLSKLKSDVGRRKVVHHRTILRDLFRGSAEDITYKYETGSLVDWYGLERKTSYARPTFTLSLDYSYEIPNLDSPHLGMLALLDSLGVNLDPAILWNAIPWSFVIDWVMNVSSWLGQFRMTNVKVETRIHQACWSYRIERIHHLYGSFNSQRGLLRQVNEIAYKRVPITAREASMGIRSSGLSSRELSLIGALGISRLS